ncbi:MAG TPA: transferase hexapeptide repeat family protein [Amaricoccus sp.]|uniref:acyltransferase n=1 Tax=Amaricoccus sp. TaxID=1872485 RepID=UPI002BA7203B|nr:transferase hexapeptide repeat family protein [Amaricoccus sp.]HPG23480.1 transferase hexapeptide repeat family protein [Amaricoccus sp.]HRW14311.1 transferase hexapeptide repeat family protein [Amaricoccus sp.]
MSVWSWDGIVPVVDPEAFVHPDATLIGDVIVAAGVYIGPQCVLRGDFGRIEIGAGANVQETCVVHTFPNLGVVVEASGHIGHGAVLHGCRICRNAMVGMNAVVMDEAEVGESSIVGALAFVPAGRKIPPRSLAVGSPAKVLRELTDQEIDWKTRGTGVYQRLSAEARGKLAPAQPLAAPEPGRRRVRAPAFDPLIVERLGLGDRPPGR